MDALKVCRYWGEEYYLNEKCFFLVQKKNMKNNNKYQHELLLEQTKLQK